MQFELLLAVALVVMVIFLFLRNVAATIIPSVAVPLSLVGTFGVMYLAGFSINNLTLMALTIATGFVVDDAIVMIENISRYIEEGETPLEAALKGSEQIGFTIISLTFSLIAVLIPLLFMGDVVGRLFREFAITLAVSILISAVVSLTLTPMMCARLLRHTPEDEQSRFYRADRRMVRPRHRALRRDARLGARPPGADAAGRHRHARRSTVVLYIFVPKGFFPVQDTGVIQGISEAPQSISFAAMARAPAGAGQGHARGSGGGKPVVVHRRRRHQHDAEQRPHADQPQAARRSAPSATEVIRRLQAASSRSVEGITLYMQPVQDLTIEDRVSRTQYQFTLETANPDELSIWVPQAGRTPARSCRSSPTSRAICRTRDCRPIVTIDRDTAGAARRHAGGHRQRALQRLRPAPDLDHLHAVEPVPRGARSEARVPQGPGVARTTSTSPSTDAARRCALERGRAR